MNGAGWIDVMKVNLHLHSRHSDGTLWPEQVVERAAKNELDQISLTDHDCMEGVDAFLHSARQAGIQAIPGVEIDCQAEEIGYNSEMLGYFPGGYWARTREFCLERMEHREKRIRELIARAAEFFKTDLTFDQLKSHKVGELQAGLDNIRISYSKPDLFEFLKSRKLIKVDTPYPAFKKSTFLAGDHDPKPSVSRVIDVILSDGGIPVLPHPGLIFKRDIQRLKAEGPAIFGWFCRAGIRALECNYYAVQNRDDTGEINRLVRSLARKLDLETTWGSDCHGPGHHSDTMEKFWGVERFPFQ